jgi:hypothetical protein
LGTLFTHRLRIHKQSRPRLSIREQWLNCCNPEAAALAAQPSETSHDDEDDGEDGDDDLGEKTEEEPPSELVERLDATVFGLMEALSARALKGSLWARQIVREGDGVEAQHRKILKVRIVSS